MQFLCYLYLSHKYHRQRITNWLACNIRSPRHRIVLPFHFSADKLNSNNAQGVRPFLTLPFTIYLPADGHSLHHLNMCDEDTVLVDDRRCLSSTIILLCCGPIIIISTSSFLYRSSRGTVAAKPSIHSRRLLQYIYHNNLSARSKWNLSQPALTHSHLLGACIPLGH